MTVNTAEFPHPATDRSPAQTDTISLPSGRVRISSTSLIGLEDVAADEDAAKEDREDKGETRRR